MNDNQDQTLVSPDPVVPTNTPTSTTPKYMDFVRSSVVNQSVKPLQRSQTLMRSTVNSPTVSPTPLVSPPSTPVDNTASSLVAPKTSVQDIDQEKLDRANNIVKSDFVNRFPNLAEPDQGVYDPPLVQNNPIVEPSVEPVYQAPAAAQPGDMFNNAIANATSHTMPAVEPEKKAGKKLVAALSTGFAVLLLAGLLVNLNLKRIDVYLAASKAGFSATMPSQGPAGYSLADVSSAAGVVSTLYKSNSDSRGYTITEKSSLWDSSTLLDSYVVEVAGSNYQTYQSDGITIYLFGSKNATWVNNGIWYVVASNNSLSLKQIVNIASSM